MLNLERILNQDRLMRAMTGLNRKAFEELLLSFTDIYRQRPKGSEAHKNGKSEAERHS
jgi:hypothetical protein